MHGSSSLGRVCEGGVHVPSSLGHARHRMYASSSLGRTCVLAYAVAIVMGRMSEDYACAIPVFWDVCAACAATSPLDRVCVFVNACAIPVLWIVCARSRVRYPVRWVVRAFCMRVRIVIAVGLRTVQDALVRS